MQHSKEEVLKIAKLARLKLDPGEEQKFSQQFSDLLQHFRKIQELATDAIEPAVHAPIGLYDSIPRPKEQAPTAGELPFAPGLIMKNIPDQLENFYRVPKVLE